MSLQGIPGIYIHSLLGSRNDYYGKSISGIARRINREKLDYGYIAEQLEKETNRKIIFKELIRTTENKTEKRVHFRRLQARRSSESVRRCWD